MLLDINAYVGHWPFKQLQHNDCAQLLERMNHFGVDQSVVSNLNGVFYKNTQSANEELHKEIVSDERFAGRLIPFAVINPIYAGWQDDLEASVELGMKGVRLYPKYHDYSLTDPHCIDLVRRIRDRNLPIALTLRMVDSRQRSWIDIEQEWKLKDIIPILREVPDARYIVLNVANSLELDEEEEELIKRTRLVFDTSGRELSDLASLLHRFGNEKFAFGTHSPILDYLTGLLRVEDLQSDDIGEDVMNLIKSGNARKILNG
jgi:predicted TIM-barrel fold metal-dependent hydrolase